MFALRTLEFDRIVRVVTGLALTPLGARVLESLEPEYEVERVSQALAATTETTAYLETNAGFPLRAGGGLDEALEGVGVEGQSLEPIALLALSDFLDSVEQAQRAVREATGSFPILTSIVSRIATFGPEIAAVRRAIDPAGEVLDSASVQLRSLRERIRHKRQQLRSTLEEFVRGKATSKYLQEQIITERNGRAVLIVRAEHRGAVPGIVHGSSASGASLFLEPAATVETNNDIVELEEREHEEIRRILLELTDAFRARPDALRTSIHIATEIDVLQAKARFGALVDGVRPELVEDGHLELRQARHPLLIPAIRTRSTSDKPTAAGTLGGPVPVDIVLEPPTRLLLITGPNTGGKTVAIKTAGLLALMAQAGLHVPAHAARLPIFQSVFADIGDEQSISASLSTFSAHIANIVSMDREFRLPALVLLDEVGTGTDPSEGGALATAIVNHFSQRGALVIATTHYDALKTWGTATHGVMTAAFAFDPQTFTPTYRLIYGAPGRSLAIEIAQRLGMPLPLVAAARGFLSDDQKRLAAHLSRIDAQARALDADRLRLQRERRAIEEATAKLAERERAIADREERFARRLNEKLDDRVRQARRDIDDVIRQLKERSEALIDQASVRARPTGVSTGETGAARAEAREAVERIVEQLRHPGAGRVEDQPPRTSEAGPPTVGTRVVLGGLGIEGTLIGIQGQQAEIDAGGKRLRAPLSHLRVVGPPDHPRSGGAASVRVNLELQPREGSSSELNVIGCTVDEAIDRVSRLLDDTLVTDQRQVRIVHGHGTGQLRRGLAAYLKDHPLVSKFYSAPQEQGGGGATIVELKE